MEKTDRKSKAYLFEKAGAYTLKIKDQKSGQSSNTVKITVREPTENERQSAQLFLGGKHATSAILHIGTEGWHEMVRTLEKDKETLSNFEKIVKDYADTPFAPYASHILGAKKYTETATKWGGSADKDPFVKEFTEIIPLFLPALKIEKSRIQEESLFMIQECYFMMPDNTRGEEYYRLLISKYPHGKYAEQAKGDYERMKQIEKEKEESQKRTK